MLANNRSAPEQTVVAEQPVVVEKVVQEPVIIEKVVEKPVVVEKTVVKEVYLPCSRVIQGNPTIIREKGCPMPENPSSAKYCGCNTKSGVTVWEDTRAAVMNGLTVFMSMPTRKSRKCIRLRKFLSRTVRQ